MANLLTCCVALLLYMTIVFYAPPKFWRKNAIKMILLMCCLLSLFSHGLDDYRAEQAHSDKQIALNK